MSGIRFYWSVLRSVHACCLPLSAKQDGLRYLAFLFRRVEIAIRVFSRHSSVICHGRFTSGLYVSLWRSRRGYRGAGTRERGTGLAARPLCVFAQPHWHCEFFRGEYVGAPRPKPAPKSLRLSGLSSRCGGAALVRIRAVTRVHGKTRPSPIYARAGRAV